MTVKNYISTSSEWTFPLLMEYDEIFGKIAAEYGLDTYPNQIEVITAEQMMDAYASSGMPIGYHHWSYGKHFMNIEKTYRRGRMGLAFEIVINSNPCIAYLMEENTMAMQALVIAHACYGHNSFFKGNYMFRTWTSADAIIDYLLFAKNYIRSCEERFGTDEVERLLDSCHTLMNQGVDRYKRPAPLSLGEEEQQQRDRAEYLQSQVNELWRTVPQGFRDDEESVEKRFPSESQENLLYFIEKHAPLLEPWQREIVRIVRKIAQYFYPQRQTKVMNEGWACFWHYTLVNELYERDLIDDGFMLEFLQSHTNVLSQPGFDSPFYSGLNPYTLGYHMMIDIRRICENPTAEDRYWFPNIAGSDWKKTLDFAMRNFKDESFIAQFLSPKVIRDLKLFSVLDDDQSEELEISAIHNEQGYRRLRAALADQYNLHSLEPNVQVYSVDTRGDRSLTLRHNQYQRRPLQDDTLPEMMRHVHRLWGFPVRLETSHDGEEYELTADCG
ncbi:MAG: SpoVR family protein [Gammaproteobacteria bacterium]|nr:SpoVR family protein [Gammaproteobacteria bacterium]MDH3768143.1 SpoVR family protein [Gammaproteobacteria bacterium]